MSKFHLSGLSQKYIYLDSFQNLWIWYTQLKSMPFWITKPNSVQNFLCVFLLRLNRRMSERQKEGGKSWCLAQAWSCFNFKHRIPCSSTTDPVEARFGDKTTVIPCMDIMRVYTVTACILSNVSLSSADLKMLHTYIVELWHDIYIMICVMFMIDYLIRRANHYVNKLGRHRFWHGIQKADT